MKKTTKLFIVCAAVCAAGIIMAMIGFAMGGVEDIDKVAERYDWAAQDQGKHMRRLGMWINLSRSKPKGTWKSS